MTRSITLAAAATLSFAAFSQQVAPISGSNMPAGWLYAQSADSAFSSALEAGYHLFHSKKYPFSQIMVICEM